MILPEMVEKYFSILSIGYKTDESDYKICGRELRIAKML